MAVSTELAKKVKRSIALCNLNWKQEGKNNWYGVADGWKVKMVCVSVLHQSSACNSSFDSSKAGKLAMELLKMQDNQPKFLTYQKSIQLSGLQVDHHSSDK